MTISVAGEELILNAEKCLYWPSIEALILSDLHLGKSGHFRKSGIPLLQGSDALDLERIDELIKRYSPERIIFLGDLFHSSYNTEWELLSNWTKQYRGKQFELVQGNHDLLPTGLYDNAGIKVYPFLAVHGIGLSHEPMPDLNLFNIYGHIHPGIRLVGKAKQAIRIPCFILNDERMILPAFGSLTGLYIIQPKGSESVFGVANRQVINLSL